LSVPLKKAELLAAKQFRYVSDNLKEPDRDIQHINI